MHVHTAGQGRTNAYGHHSVRQEGVRQDEAQRDRQTDGWTDMQTGEWMDRQKDKAERRDR